MTIGEIRKMFKLKDFTPGEHCIDLRSYMQLYFEDNCPTTKYQDGTTQCYYGCNRSFYDLYFNLNFQKQQEKN